MNLSPMINPDDYENLNVGADCYNGQLVQKIFDSELTLGLKSVPGMQVVNNQMMLLMMAQLKMVNHQNLKIILGFKR